ncbi:ribonuclease CAF1 [Hesseltinella vesiculosa]|uniref:Ribonuclease CAF1 n=1 Tax=Hesseltinella vesiculosa TaxID=101127 RepID=A0A1X2GBY3_9FUNG|nr:ribonuclease CAF1 [Hesseltinella vesiculosa]
MSVSYTEVTNDNFASLLDPLLAAIAEADYIAFDSEFSGFCSKITKHMEQRYVELCQVIQTHSLFSFGLTLISRKNKTDKKNRTRFDVTNVEFLTSNQNTFQVDPKNMRFLAESGLDFGRIFRVGIPFHDGSLLDLTSYGDDPDHPTLLIRRFWFSVLKIVHDKKIPLVVHNGLLDVMYLYQSFFATLPAKLGTFVADLDLMFPGGFYDTKYLSTAVAGEQVSYLAYVYGKCLRLGQPLLKIKTKPSLAPADPTDAPASSFAVDLSGLLAPIPANPCRPTTTESASKKRRKRAAANTSNTQAKKTKLDICSQYASHGYCRLGNGCPMTHDMDRILDRDLGTTDSTTAKVQANDNDDLADPPMSSAKRLHSSHFDAYMTAYAFCYFITTLPEQDVQDALNKINLMRLDIPLRIMPSHYSSPSQSWQRLKSFLWP